MSSNNGVLNPAVDSSMMCFAVNVYFLWLYSAVGLSMNSIHALLHRLQSSNVSFKFLWKTSDRRWSTPLSASLFLCTRLSDQYLQQCAPLSVLYSTNMPMSMLSLSVHLSTDVQIWSHCQDLLYTDVPNCWFFSPPMCPTVGSSLPRCAPRLVLLILDVPLCRCTPQAIMSYSIRHAVNANSEVTHSSKTGLFCLFFFLSRFYYCNRSRHGIPIVAFPIVPLTLHKNKREHAESLKIVHFLCKNIFRYFWSRLFISFFSFVNIFKIFNFKFRYMMLKIGNFIYRRTELV